MTSFFEQRSAVNHDAGTLGVATLLQLECELQTAVTRTVVHFAFVGHADIEDRRLIHRHIAALVHIDIQFGVLQLERTG